MKILVLNSGSSSIKFQLINMPSGEVICSGLAERIGLDDARLHFKKSGNQQVLDLNLPDHKAGLEAIAQLLMDSENGVINDEKEIIAVGHRVVHGGNSFSKTSEISEEVKKEIEHLSSLAPLHNPANLSGIEVSETVFPHAKQVAVFDTAFHQSIPEKAHRYALPERFYEEENIRLYGFHGTSHKYVSEQALEMIGKTNSKIITLHLGNGCSMTAIQDGKSIDHTLGFGPLTGLIMGTRSGDIDPLIIFHLVNELGYKLEEVNNLLQKQSGLTGITGMSDLREIEQKALDGDRACQLAIDMMTYRIKKYIGAYTAAMNGLDAIIFTGGIGENSVEIRKGVCEGMSYFGVAVDQEKNTTRTEEARAIQATDSKVQVLVIPTNEELEIAKQTFELIHL
jgi:acetate kinase